MSQIIHPYDYVRVKIPKFFVRCGYPIQHENEVNRIYHDHAKDIIEFLHKVGISIPLHNSHTPLLKAPLKIAKAIAYDLLCQKGFGGPNRTIFTIELPEYKDKDFHVQSVKFVKTGTYTPARTSKDANGDTDYDQAHLTNIKTHRIIETPFIYKKHGRKDWIRLRIQADNLQILATPATHHKTRKNKP